MAKSTHRSGTAAHLAVSLLALASVLGLAALAVAGLIPGGKSVKTDCYLELEVSGIDNPSERVEKNKIVLCTDGEACDTGPCGDDLCNMQVAACINQTDPNLPDCTPPSGLDKVKIKGAFTIQIPQLLEGSACGSFLDAEVPVKVKRNGMKKTGKRKVKGMAKAVKGTKPRKDPDNWTLECVPRTVECSTTTTTSTSTTTSTLPCACGAQDPAQFKFVTGVGTGNCGRVQDAGGNTLLDLACGGLYFGGGEVNTPLPAVVPDMASPIANVSLCSGTMLELTNATEADTGSKRTCTSEGCLFAAPLPIPNVAVSVTSVCIVNNVSADATGSANCATGEASLNLPLSSDLYLMGDLLDGSATDRPDVAGIQPCPICVGTPGSETCQGGPNHGMACAPATSDTGDAYPTSHDCPPPLYPLGPPPPPADPNVCDPGLGCLLIGSLPIAFSLSTGQPTLTASNLGPNATNVFCGFCRDRDGALAFADPAQPCTSNAQCSGEFEACEQQENGAFNQLTAQTIVEDGAPGGDLTDGNPHAATLSSVFCIPPSFNAIVDGAGGLPGPGATALPGTIQLLP